MKLFLFEEKKGLKKRRGRNKIRGTSLYVYEIELRMTVSRSTEIESRCPNSVVAG